MTPLNNFAELYKTITHTELLRIIDHPGDYQPLAVEAAKNELLNRQLSDEEMRVAKEPLIAEQELRKQKREKAKLLEDKAKAARDIFVDTVMPQSDGVISTEKIIRMFIITFGGMFLYTLIRDFRTHFLFIKDILAFPVMSAAYLIPAIALPIGVYQFWKRRKAGWILLAGFLTFSAIEVVALFVQSIRWEPSGISTLDYAFKPPSPVACVLKLLFFSGALYMVCKENIREVFHITNKEMLAATGVSAAIAFLLMIVIL